MAPLSFTWGETHYLNQQQQEVGQQQERLGLEQQQQQDVGQQQQQGLEQQKQQLAAAVVEWEQGRSEQQQQQQQGAWEGEEVVVSVHNSYNFLSTSHLQLQWRVKVHGVPVKLDPATTTAATATTATATGLCLSATAGVCGNSHEDVAGWQVLQAVASSPLPTTSSSSSGGVPAGQSHIYSLGYTAVDLVKAAAAVAATAGGGGGVRSSRSPVGPGDVAIEVRGVLHQDAPWATAGHVVAMQQLQLQQLLPMTKPAAAVLGGKEHDQQQQEVVEVVEDVVRRVVEHQGSTVHHLVTSSTTAAADTEAADPTCQNPGGATAGLVVRKVPATSTPATADHAAAAHATTTTTTTSSSSSSSSSSKLLEVLGPDGLKVVWDVSTGCCCHMEKGGQVLVTGAMLPCLMRASTDNDRGGFSPGSSYAARWAAAGLDRLTVEGEVRGKGEGEGR
jgi:hypothetical protein